MHTPNVAQALVTGSLLLASVDALPKPLTDLGKRQKDSIWAPLFPGVAAPSGVPPPPGSTGDAFNQKRGLFGGFAAPSGVPPPAGSTGEALVNGKRALFAGFAAPSGVPPPPGSTGQVFYQKREIEGLPIPGAAAPTIVSAAPWKRQVSASIEPAILPENTIAPPEVPQPSAAPPVNPEQPAEPSNYLPVGPEYASAINLEKRQSKGPGSEATTVPIAPVNPSIAPPKLNSEPVAPIETSVAGPEPTTGPVDPVNPSIAPPKPTSEAVAPIETSVAGPEPTTFSKAPIESTIAQPEQSAPVTSVQPVLPSSAAAEPTSSSAPLLAPFWNIFQKRQSTSLGETAPAASTLPVVPVPVSPKTVATQAPTPISAPAPPPMSPTPVAPISVDPEPSASAPAPPNVSVAPGPGPEVSAPSNPNAPSASAAPWSLW